MLTLAATATTNTTGGTEENITPRLATLTTNDHVQAPTIPIEMGATWSDLVGPRLKSRPESRGPPLSLALLVHRPLAAAWHRL